MAKKTARGRKQDRARVAGKQDYEVRYEAKKTGKSKGEVKRADGPKADCPGPFARFQRGSPMISRT